METHGITEVVLLIVFQLSFILFVAKIAGEFTERFLKQPSVLGELVIGIIVGPYLLGSKIVIPSLGPLFPLANSSNVASIPVSPELYTVAQIAVIILLFVAGVETDLSAFLKYARPATIIALGGVIFPFIFGVLTTYFMGFSKSLMDPTALFMGAALTATSVGITARILADIGRLNTPEGVTILAGAVVDDVLGILVLAIVVSISISGVVSIGEVSIITLKAVGIWIVLMVVGFLLSNRIVRFLRSLRSEGAWLTIAVAFGLLFSALAELFGLAMIIGAYVMGLAFSKTDIKQELVENLTPVYHIFVPIFFVVMGMFVNVKVMGHAILYAVVLSIVAIVGKVAGCGIPALFVGFNKLGSTRIGIGMLPRGEVALIIAGVAITRGVIETDIYGVAVFMTMITTLLAPIFLVPAFKIKSSGLKNES